MTLIRFSFILFFVNRANVHRTTLLIDSNLETRLIRTICPNRRKLLSFAELSYTVSRSISQIEHELRVTVRSYKRYSRRRLHLSVKSLVLSKFLQSIFENLLPPLGAPQFHKILENCTRWNLEFSKSQIFPEKTTQMTLKSAESSSHLFRYQSQLSTSIYKQFWVTVTYLP